MCQNISKEPVCRIYYSKIYSNSEFIIRILYILNHCTPILLISGTITFAILAHVNVFHDFANTHSITHSIIAYFVSFLIFAIKLFIIADLNVFLVSSLIISARLFVFCVSFISSVFCNPYFPYITNNSSILYVFYVFYVPYLLCNFIIV